MRRALKRTKRTEASIERPAPAKKDRKRWCGGHIGREHKIVIGRKQAYASFWSFSPDRLPVIRYCETCGKELDTHFFWPDRVPPEWVTQFLEAEAGGRLSP